MIDREHKLSIARQAELLNISLGTVYYLPLPVSPAELALMLRIDELHPGIRSWVPGCCAVSYGVRASRWADGTSGR